MQSHQQASFATEGKLERALDLYDGGKLAEAERVCRLVLADAPQNVIALRLAGVIAYGMGRNEDAERFLARANVVEPDDSITLDFRGKALQNLGRLDEALACHDAALAIAPDFAEAHNNRGAVLLRLGRFEEALGSYEAAIALMPRYIEALYNRGTVFLHLGRLTQALTSLDRAIDAAPDFAKGHYSRGVALARLGRFDEAVAAFDRALEIEPEFADALRDRGLALEYVNRHEEAAETYARLRGTESHYSGVYVEAVCKMLYAQMLCSDWREFDSGRKFIADVVEQSLYPVQPFVALFYAQSPAFELKGARQFVAANFPRMSDALWKGERYRHEKIRIAYLSADFRDHAVSYLIAELFEVHDRNRFEIFGISLWPDDKSEMRRRVERAFDRFIDVVDRSDFDVALLLRELEIDIAVHLNGHTNAGRVPIMAHRPVPIQVSYLGFPGTMGADFIDYIIADRHVLPPEEEAFYAEKVVWLPDTYQINDRKRAVGPIPTRAEAELPEKAFIFCCFNRNSKITPEVFDIWMRLLHRVENSVLWLRESNPAAGRNLKREAVQRGIPEQRLIFAPFRKLEDHLARQTLADLVLDTLPYNAHTTTSDALWAGVPVVTCRGPTFAARVASSLLNAVGLPELVTTSLADYENLAFTLATTPGRLGEIRSKLARNRRVMPLFDTRRFCSHIERAYVTMWGRYQRGEEPESFAVDPVA